MDGLLLLLINHWSEADFQRFLLSFLGEVSRKYLQNYPGLSFWLTQIPDFFCACMVLQSFLIRIGGSHFLTVVANVSRQISSSFFFQMLARPKAPKTVLIDSAAAGWGSQFCNCQESVFSIPLHPQGPSTLNSVHMELPGVKTK